MQDAKDDDLVVGDRVKDQIRTHGGDACVRAEVWARTPDAGEFTQQLDRREDALDDRIGDIATRGA